MKKNKELRKSETDKKNNQFGQKDAKDAKKDAKAELTAMGFDNDTIAEEFQYARNVGNKRTTSTPTLDQYSRDLTELAAEGKSAETTRGQTADRTE